MKLDRKLVLASSSPRRREYLSLLGLQYDVDSPDVDENIGGELPPGEQAVAVARRKAQAVAGKHPGAIILGADTMVVLGAQRLGKPEDKADAERMLHMLQGREHRVYTGICIMDTQTGKLREQHVCTLVHMDDMDAGAISRYVAGGEPMDKAGAYAIQGEGCAFIKGIVGCFYNVLGLPVNAIYKMLLDIDGEKL